MKIAFTFKLFVLLLIIVFSFILSSDERTIGIAPNLQQDSVKLDFSGLMIDSIPMPLEFLKPMISKLEKFDWNNEFKNEDIYLICHETVFAQQIPSINHANIKWIVVTFTNYGGNYCHAARGRLSLFEFQQNQNRWQLTHNYMAFGDGEEYGWEPSGLALVKIGNNNSNALIVHTMFTGNMGHEMEFKEVYAELNDSFRQIFCLKSYEYYNSFAEGVKYNEGYVKMRIVKSKKSWFDFETATEGVDWSEKTPGAITRYVFNGKKYVKVR